jgi:hypothetical protein
MINQIGCLPFSSRAIFGKHNIIVSSYRPLNIAAGLSPKRGKVGMRCNKDESLIYLEDG